MISSRKWVKLKSKEHLKKPPKNIFVVLPVFTTHVGVPLSFGLILQLWCLMSPAQDGSAHIWYILAQSLYIGGNDDVTSIFNCVDVLNMQQAI